MMPHFTKFALIIVGAIADDVNIYMTCIPLPLCLSDVQKHDQALIDFSYSRDGIDGHPSH
jgi:hypothetical protein